MNNIKYDRIRFFRWLHVPLWLLIFTACDKPAVVVTTDIATPDISEYLIEVESPPDSGEFVSMDFSIIPSTTPRVRISISGDTDVPLDEIGIILASSDPDLPDTDLTHIFIDGLMADATATNTVPVKIGYNSLHIHQQVAELASSGMLNFSENVSVVSSKFSFPGVPDPINEDEHYEDEVILLVFDPDLVFGSGADAINGFLRQQRLRPLDLIVEDRIIRARITTGETPRAMSQRLASAGIPGLLNVMPNMEQLPDNVAGESMPETLQSSYRMEGGENCTGGSGRFGCFQHAGPMHLNQVWKFHQHFFMDTFAGHRLVEKLVDPITARRVGLAIIDKGLGNYASDPCAVSQDVITVADVPCRDIFRISTPVENYDIIGRPIDGNSLVIQRSLDEIKDDEDSHGTQVSAAAVGRGNQSGNSYLGIGKHVRIRPLQYERFEFDGIRALRAAVNDGDIHVINASYGRQTSWIFTNLMQNQMVERGKIMSASAGNEGNDNPLHFPSSFSPGEQDRSNDAPLVLSAGGVELRRDFQGPEQLWADSSYGDHQSVTAYGAGLLLPDRDTGAPDLSNGTSFAAPAVAGLAAEMLYLDKNLSGVASLTSLQIVETLEATADDLGCDAEIEAIGSCDRDAEGIIRPNSGAGNGWDIFFGHGRINVWKALLSVVNRGIASDSAPRGFPHVSRIDDAGTAWYGFKIYSPVLNASVWLDGEQIRDNNATSPAGDDILSYAGVESGGMNSLGLKNEHVLHGIVPLGNHGGEYLVVFSINRDELLEGGEAKTLSLRREGQGPESVPFFNLKLDLPTMREGKVPGVVFDDFIFYITLPDFGDADADSSTLGNNGARHLNTNLEWLGNEPLLSSVSPEQDAVSSVASVPDPDGVNNILRGTPDLDGYDDGVIFYPLSYRPGETGRADVRVCTSDPDSSRYDDNILYVNGWIDWNTDGDWDGDDEHAVDNVRLVPHGGDDGGWLALSPRSSNTTTALLETSESGRCVLIKTGFIVPERIGGGDLWARFRLDYGENAGRVERSDMLGAMGPARYGEVEDYILGTDFGDAPEPYRSTGGYQALKGSRGARHLAIQREWLGVSQSAPAVSRELDACDSSTAEQDGVPNLGENCLSANSDGSDNGIKLPYQVSPLELIRVEIDVAARVDGYGIDVEGFGSGAYDGIRTLNKQCRMVAINGLIDSPEQSHGRNRYAASDARRRLYLNAWADWNGDGFWTDSEKVISGPLDPESWGKDGRYTSGEPFTDSNSDGIWSEGEPFVDLAGETVLHISCPVQVPKNVVRDQEYYWRFRLDYGENAATDTTVEKYATESERILLQAIGGALWGEVEDHPQISATSSPPKEPPPDDPVPPPDDGPEDPVPQPPHEEPEERRPVTTGSADRNKRN